MSKITLLLALCLTTATALPQQRIAGGAVATLGNHPYAAALLYATDNINFRLSCAGTILNNRSVLTATSCVLPGYPHQVRVRVGSFNVTSGGSLHATSTIIHHANYNEVNRNNNIAILRVTVIFPFGNNVRPAIIAGTNYHLDDYQYVWAIGWGQTTLNGATSEQLRRVEIRTVNQARCQNIFGLNFINVNMLCAGWQASVRGSCAADTGAPLLHNRVVVGITSFTVGCGDVNYPSVYTRVSRYATWIQNNA